MGLIIADEMNVYGLSLSNCYVNVDNLIISKTGSQDMKYVISTNVQCFTSRTARNQNEQTISMRQLRLLTNDTTNLHEQVYTLLKKDYKNYTDDFDEIEETSNLPRI
jgi:hypothetical protein